MQLQTHTWERALLSLAHEAHQAEPTPHHLHHIDAATLASAYDYCESVIAIHSKSFLLASALLPQEKRRAVRALYAFCRVTDDIVDRGSSDSRTQLEQWRRHILAHHPPQDDLVAIAWADARLRYRVPVRYGEQLIDGVARDLTQSRYQTFEELAAYCYAVASTVGLMSMHVIGYAGAHAIPYAIKLGNRLLYTEAAPGIALLDRDGRFAIAAAAGLYQGILQDIEAHDYNVFSRRAFVRKWGKLRRLPGIWWGCR